MIFGILMNHIFNRKKKSDNPPCERCGAATIPIIYGYPSESLFRRAARGEIALGGCIIHANNPRFRCTAGCDAEKIAEQIDNE